MATPYKSRICSTSAHWISSSGKDENGNARGGRAGKYGYNYVTVSISGTEVEGTINGVRYRVTVDANGKLVYTRI